MGIVLRRHSTRPFPADRIWGASLAQPFRDRRNFCYFCGSRRKSMRFHRSRSWMTYENSAHRAPRPVRGGRHFILPKPTITTRHLIQSDSQKRLHSDPALIALLSWTLLLQLQAECLPPASQQAGGRLLNEGRLPRTAAISLEGWRLVIKLNRRKHMATGATIFRK